MNASVYFNDKSVFLAEKICDEGIDPHLSAEFKAA